MDFEKEKKEFQEQIKNLKSKLERVKFEQIDIASRAKINEDELKAAKEKSDSELSLAKIKVKNPKQICKKYLINKTKLRLNSMN